MVHYRSIEKITYTLQNKLEGIWKPFNDFIENGDEGFDRRKTWDRILEDFAAEPKRRMTAGFENAKL